MGSRRPRRPTTAAQLATDQRIVETLLAEGLDGPTWSKLAEDLANYGRKLLVVQIRSGEIFAICRRRGVLGRLDRPPEAGLLIGDAEDIASESVARAIVTFQLDLHDGKWSPERRATLKTYFYGQCLFRFADVYGPWRKRIERREMWETLMPHDAPAMIRIPSDDDPARTVADRDDLNRRLAGLTPRQAEIMLLRAEGYTQATIAELVGVSVSTVEREIARAKRAGLRGGRYGEGGADA